MQEVNQSYGYNVAEEEDSGFDFKKLVPLIMLNWQWIVASVIICMGAAYAYLRYAPRVYSGQVKVLIKDDNGGRRRSNSIDLSDMTGITMANNGFENEMEIIQSSYIAARAVKTLKLYTTYTMEGRVADNDIYNSTPVKVDLEEERVDELKTTISLIISKAAKGIDVECTAPLGGEKFTSVKHFDKLPATIPTPLGTLMLTPNPASVLGEKRLMVTISPVMSVARSYAARLSGGSTNKAASVATLTFVDGNAERVIDYLKTVVESYNSDANEDKNEIGRRTEEFINERLLMIRSELDSTEIDLQHFKQNNSLINLTSDASTALAGSNEYQRRQVEMQTQQTIVKSLLDYVNNPANAYKVLPSSSLISGSQSLVKQIDEYNAIVMERDRLLKTSSPTAPLIVKMTEQMDAALPIIQQSLHLYYSDMLTQRASIDRQYAHYTGKVASTPAQERALNNIMRQQEVKVGLYLMLLQKREENAITQTYTAVKARVIDDPLLTGLVSPNSSMIYGTGLAVGLGIPLALLLLIEFLRYRIEGRADVEKLTKIPVLADIPLSHKLKKGERAIVVHANSNDMMKEAFRGLRTNLRFVMHDDEKVLLLTSVIPGEGKTFVATNLAVSIALLGKKVLLIGLDVRKPRLVNLFNITDKKRGLTNYLMTDGQDFSLLEEQIFSGVANPNLDVLPAGVVPPNPGELIAQPQLKMAIDYLRGKYDFIVIDTPPVGLVSDTFDIAALADASLVVCRADVSPKANFTMINQAKEDNKLPKMNIVLNGVDLSRKKYGYYYGYGKYGHYGRYGKYYGHYGAYGTYGHYGDQKKKN